MIAADAPAGVTLAAAVASMVPVHPWRLIVCDVDSTLIAGEVIEMLADRAGHLAEVAAITEAAMRGDLDFGESLRRRVALLAGLDEVVLSEIGAGLRLTPGARELMDTAARAGLRRGIVSGGFSQVTRYLVDDLGLDFSAANTLQVEDGKLTGRLVGPVIDRAGKAAALRSFAEASGVPMTATVAIGDGANDIDMLAAAGFSIAFNAKSVVTAHADAIVDGPSLAPVIGLLGLPGRDRVANTQSS